MYYVVGSQPFLFLHIEELSPFVIIDHIDYINNDYLCTSPDYVCEHTEHIELEKYLMRHFVFSAQCFM